MRYLAAPLAAAILAFAAPAVAASLIGFVDNTPNTGLATFLSDANSNWATSWTQSVASSNVTVRAIVGTGISPAPPANWWITTVIGVDATLADVVASGIYTASNSANPFESFNPQPRVELASGLAFGAGTYFLVLDGPAGPLLNNANWIGGSAPDSANVAPGFSLGPIYMASVGVFGGGAQPNAFGPASAFRANAIASQFLVFELDGQAVLVPEPATWALLITGFGLAGAALRRRRGAVAARPV